MKVHFEKALARLERLLDEHARRAQEAVHQRDRVLGRRAAGRTGGRGAAAFAVDAQQVGAQLLRVGGVRDDLQSRRLPHGLGRGAVRRVRDRHVQRAVHHGKRQHKPAQRNRRGHAHRADGVDGDRVQIQPFAAHGTLLSIRRRLRSVSGLRVSASAACSAMRPRSSSSARDWSSVTIPARAPVSIIE